jgi:hypothetical protein
MRLIVIQALRWATGNPALVIHSARHSFATRVLTRWSASTPQFIEVTWMYRSPQRCGFRFWGVRINLGERFGVWHVCLAMRRP